MESGYKKKYFISFIDGKSKYVVIKTTFAKSVDETLKYIIWFKSEVRKTVQQKMKRFDTDNGGEYKTIKLVLAVRAMD